MKAEFKVLFLAVYLGCTLFFSCSHSDDAEEVSVSGVIELLCENESLTNESVRIIVTGEKKIAAAYWYKGSYSGSGQSLIKSQSSVEITQTEGIWAFPVSENSVYSVGVRFSDGTYTLKRITVRNIDRMPPAQVSKLGVNYYGGETIKVSWTDPVCEGSYDSPLAEVLVSWRKNDGEFCTEISIEPQTEEYVVPVSGTASDYYEISVRVKDELGNTGEPEAASRYLKVYTEKEKTAGNIITPDGTFTPSEYKERSLSDAVAVVAFVNADGVPVGIGLTHSDGNLPWGTLESGGYQLFFEKNLCTPHASNLTYLTPDGSTVTAGSCKYSSKRYDSLDFTGDTRGEDNWECMKAYDPECTSSDTAAAEYYPAFSFIQSYSSGGISDGWYMPSVAELCYLVMNIGKVNSGLSLCGGTPLGNCWYWSSSQADSSAFNVWSLKVISAELNVSQLVSASCVPVDEVTFEYVKPAEGNAMADSSVDFSSGLTVEVYSGEILGDVAELDRVGIENNIDLVNPFLDELEAEIEYSEDLKYADIYYSLSERLNEYNYESAGTEYKAPVRITSTCTLWAVAVINGKIAGTGYGVFSKCNKIKTPENGYAVPLRVFN
ncbi:hypothetical protein [Treponema sp.]|uniref:hypothetical protein n=1 Tax=Treponema sp. TaxID=166 RepID=UPI00257A196C|nr:hypothetical protein [Treponema sp.]MBE6353494.1 hypothetical protein [Treponema sp.]